MIGAIVLAAGSSTRMGRQKAELPSGPGRRTFVETIVATLETAGVSTVRVVVAPGRETGCFKDVVNPDPAAGMLSSLLCGLRALPPGLEAVVVWPVDHPLVERDTVVSMIDAFRNRQAPIVVPTHDGRRGHPVLFAARVLHELFTADVTRGAAAVVHAHEDRLELAVADRGVLHDIDTPEDYARVIGVAIPASGHNR